MLNVPMIRYSSLLALVLVPASLMAHPGHGEVQAVSAALHPWQGLDHLLAMLAVGALGWRLGGKATWALPATFVGGMCLGTLLSVLGLPGFGVEWIIAASVVLLGALIALPRLPTARWLAVPLLIGALAHGHAHGAELGGAAIPFFVISTAVLHALGAGAAWLAVRQGNLLSLRIAGGTVATAGLWLCLGLA